MRRESLRRLLILLLFVYASFSETLVQGADATYGTAIAVYRTERKIVVAADSKAVGEEGTSSVDTICKIRQFGDIFVTAAGLYRSYATGYDLWEIVSLAAFGRKGLSDIVKRFETFVSLPLQNAVTAIKNREPTLYQERHINKPAVAVLFFGIEDNVLTRKYREFYLHPEVDDVPFPADTKAYDCPGDLCPDG
jgi:hypothetical protein